MNAEHIRFLQQIRSKVSYRKQIARQIFKSRHKNGRGNYFPLI